MTHKGEHVEHRLNNLSSSNPGKKFHIEKLSDTHDADTLRHNQAARGARYLSQKWVKPR